MNPQKSGISDYSEELLPFLAEHAEIDLFLEEGVTPTSPDITEQVAFYPHTKFEQCHQRRSYDLCLYQMGNNTACHHYMDTYIQRYPGIVTLHDYALHHFYAEMFAREERYDEYQTAMESYYGQLGKQIAERFRRGIQSDYVYYQLPFYQRVVDPSLGTVVHSLYVKDRLLWYNPNYRVEMIPMGIMTPSLEQYNADTLHTKYQLLNDRFIIASFGFIIEGKRIRELLHAFAHFVKEVPEALCLLVGKESPSFDVRALVRELDLKEHVLITGYVTYEAYFEYIVLSDVCVNLRFPTVRATSANILKIMAFDKPVLVSDLCELLDIPSDVCVKIPLDDTEETALLDAFHRLYHNTTERMTLGNRAREFVETHHSIQQAANKYLEFCAHILHETS